MKRKITISILIIALLIVSCRAVFGQKTQDPGIQTAKTIGDAMNSSVQEIEAKDISEKNGYRMNNNDIVMIVMGENISKEYFNVRKELYAVCGSTDPVTDAINSLKLEVLEKKFAEEHNLLPTESEILALTQEMRDTAESTEESLAIVKQLISSVGLTEDQYWEEYKPKFETPVQLIKSRVNKYLEDNNLPELDISEIECEIINRDYLDNISKKSSGQ